jgi:hypothetical protein
MHHSAMAQKKPLPIVPSPNEKMPTSVHMA